jgi:hypothetical protein
MKKIRVILSSDAKEVYNHLKEEAPKSKTERTILNSIKKKIENYKIKPTLWRPNC